MASEKDHIALANKNHDCLMHLLPNVATHPEWVATIAFYKAVQIAEAVLDALMGKDSTSHRDREDNIKTHPKLKSAFKDYQSLLTASRIARYLPPDTKLYKTFSDYMSPDDVERVLVYQRLYRFEQQMIPFMTNAGSLTKIQPPPAKPTSTPTTSPS